MTTLQRAEKLNLLRADAFRVVFAAVSRWAANRAAARALHALDDGMLKDMGISRAGIDRAVRHGRPGEPGRLLINRKPSTLEYRP